MLLIGIEDNEANLLDLIMIRMNDGYMFIIGIEDNEVNFLEIDHEPYYDHISLAYIIIRK